MPALDQHVGRHHDPAVGGRQQRGVVTRADDVDNEVLNRIVEIYQTDQDVLDGAQESAGGTAVFLQTPASELQDSLATTEEALRAE